MRNLSCLLVLLWSFLATTGFAQTPPRTSPTAQADSGKVKQPPAQPLKESKAPEIIARVTNASGVSDKDSTRLRLGDYVRLEIDNLSEVMKRKGGLKPEQLRLYVDDIVLAKVPPYSADTANGIIIFPLTRNLSSEPFWRIFYQFPAKYEHTGKLGIGSEIAQIAEPYPAKETIQIVLIRERQLVVGLILVLGFAYLLYWLGYKYSLLREDWSNQFNPNSGNISRVPFSLAKVQLAFWTFLIVAGYFIIWLVTGELAHIPESLLALLGISLSERIVGKGINFKQAQTGVIRTQDKPSAGFFWDILNDENGVSLARLQFVLFNLIIGFSFIRNLVKSWSLLDIDSSSLVLLTISGAGYLIMKNAENNAPPGSPSPVPAVPGNAQPPATPAGTSSQPAASGGGATTGNSGSQVHE